MTTTMLDPIFDYTDYNYFDGSSALSQAWYNSGTRTLVVEFVNGGLAGYSDVNEYTWKALINAASAGSYYAYNIKNIFPGFSTPDALTFEYFGDDSPEPVVAKDTPPTRRWTVEANVTALVVLDVTGDTIEDALRNYRANVNEAMDGNEVSVDFRSIKPA